VTRAVDADRRAEIERLEDENAALRLRIDDLEAALYRPDLLIPDAWGLTKRQRDLFGALIASGPAVLTREAAMSALYAGRDWPECGKILDVLICHVRRKIAPDGFGIETAWGRGWRLDEATRAVFCRPAAASRDDAVRAASAAFGARRISGAAFARRMEACGAVAAPAAAGRSSPASAL